MIDDDLYAPIARFGFALAARAKRPTGKGGPHLTDQRGSKFQLDARGKRFLLDEIAADRAVAAISARQGEFEASVERSIFKAGWTVDKQGRPDNLSGFEFDRRHGVIADFTERTVARPSDGTELLMRYCVTVCSQPGGRHGRKGGPSRPLVIWQSGAGRSMPQHSKVWVRFSCVKFRNKAPDTLSLKEMRAFHNEAEALARDLKKSVIKPYKRVLGDIVRDEPWISNATLSLSTVFYIDSFTVSVLDDSFPSSYRQLVLGNGLSDLPSKSALRTGLNRLKQAFDSTASELLPIDDLGFARGVYWIDIAKTHASLVGLANNSLETRPAGEQRALKSAPSNVIGVLSGSMLASAI